MVVHHAVRHGRNVLTKLARLVYGRGMTYRAAAARIGVPAGSVPGLLVRARREFGLQKPAGIKPGPRPTKKAVTKPVAGPPKKPVIKLPPAPTETRAVFAVSRGRGVVQVIVTPVDGGKSTVIRAPLHDGSRAQLLAKKLELRTAALRMRRAGMFYSDIGKALGVSTSVAHSWVGRSAGGRKYNYLEQAALPENVVRLTWNEGGQMKRGVSKLPPEIWDLVDRRVLGMPAPKHRTTLLIGSSNVDFDTWADKWLRCRVCDVQLSAENMFPSQAGKHDWICSTCHTAACSK